MHVCLCKYVNGTTEWNKITFPIVVGWITDLLNLEKRKNKRCEIIISVSAEVSQRLNSNLKQTLHSWCTGCSGAEWGECLLWFLSEPTLKQSSVQRRSRVQTVNSNCTEAKSVGRRWVDFTNTGHNISERSPSQSRERQQSVCQNFCFWLSRLHTSLPTDPYQPTDGWCSVARLPQQLPSPRRYQETQTA